VLAFCWEISEGLVREALAAVESFGLVRKCRLEDFRRGNARVACWLIVKTRLLVLLGHLTGVWSGKQRIEGPHCGICRVVSTYVKKLI
jgi:hypothetical protein